MKRIIPFTFLALTVLQIKAQDYVIAFAGTGASATVDSVQVKNLTQNTSLTLNGDDVLHLMGVVGINQAIAQTSAYLPIYPNPMNEAGFIEFESTSPGLVTIKVSDMTGKQVILSQTEIPCGRHAFSISGLLRGIYTINIKSTGYVYSGKIISTMTGSGNPGINYVSSDQCTTSPDRLKSNKSLVPMQYDDGDQLLFTCFSGIYKTVIPLIPVQSQTVVSDFVACEDADGNHYATVSIGTQTWMAENLVVGLRIDGVQQQTNNGVIEKYCYENNEANCTIYGGLYQWNEAMQYDTIAGVQGICPSGWHIPADGEWTTLFTFLGGTSVAGGKMKSTGTIEAGTGLWYLPNTGATNETGFSAFPSGYSYGGDGTFDKVGIYGYWWSSSAKNTISSYFRFLYYNDSGVYKSGSIKTNGFSVRCVREL
jgi:uncharacterized protein (TIGR02145 family)